MTPSTGSALALVLALSLAACGGPPEEAAVEPTTAASEAAATVAASDAPSAAASASAAASPSAAASAAPSAAASAAAAPAVAANVEPAAFAQCKACHSVEPGKNGIGPSLAGIWGEKAGQVAGFEFSQPMIDSGLTWNQAGLDRYLTDPRGVVPGTKMAFGGVKDAARRQAIIDYIKGL
ncbi:MAG: hypothetical protein B7Z33_09640 [Sphingomonadales bacterium 12-68-11]|nr:MAG: hypothetical protein B7Z33_09640 [Sphingomonadales bacterium 12-68-11]